MEGLKCSSKTRMTFTSTGDKSSPVVVAFLQLLLCYHRGRHVLLSRSVEDRCLCETEEAKGSKGKQGEAEQKAEQESMSVD